MNAFLVFALLAVFLLTLSLIVSISTLRLVLRLPGRARSIVCRVVLYTSSFIHEGFHLIACLLTLTPVAEFHICRITGEGFTPGYVVHRKRGFIRTFMISTAPFWGCLFLLSLPLIAVRGDLPPVFEVESANLKLAFSAKTVTSLLQAYPPWVYPLMVFMLVILSNAILPSASDLKAALASLAVMLALLFMAYSLAPKGFQVNSSELAQTFAVINTYLLFLVMSCLGALALQAPFFVIALLIGRKM